MAAPATSRTVHDGVRLGVPVTVRVPASSANLGPGFDSLGLALDVLDVVTVEAFAPGPDDAASVEVVVEGEGAGQVPLDESHLLVRSLRAGLAHVGAGRPRLRVHCRNAIPHGRGLGSSAATIVAGLVAARGLLAEPGGLDDGALLALATAAEGHPDNAAASLFGGFTVAWMDPAPGRTGLRRAGAVRVPLDPRVAVVVAVPDGELATSRARAMLPAAVPHADAAFNAGRSALLVEALSRRPDLLLPATEDRLHQAQRAPALPATAALVAAVRARGAAAVISGAGPSVLVLGPAAEALAAVHAAIAENPAEPGAWRVLTPAITAAGAATSGGAVCEPRS
jgi:homoserine kinase